MKNKVKGTVSNRGKRKNPTLKEKVMKYSEGKGVDSYSFNYIIPAVNQYAVIKNEWELDYTDIAIFHCIQSFINSKEGNRRRMSDEYGEWNYISEGKIIKDLPLLPINSNSAIGNRITNLVRSGLIERHPKNKENSKKFIRIGDSADKLFYTPINREE